MRIPLTNKQAQMLSAYFEQARTAARSGNPGMLVAQLRHSDAEGTYWMEPGWLEHEIAMRITEKAREVSTSAQCKHDDGDCHAEYPCEYCPKYRPIDGVAANKI